MLISIVNRSRLLGNADVQAAIRAINRQLAEDFEPYWHLTGRLRLDLTALQQPTQQQVGTDSQAFDAVIYLEDKLTMAQTEGYHDSQSGLDAIGFVFLDEQSESTGSWTAALSREAMAIVADPTNSLLIQGPHPHDHRRLVFHTMDPCHAVRGEYYQIDGVHVANFVLPAYFRRVHSPNYLTDFLGRPNPGESLPPFGFAPGGFAFFFDTNRPEGEKWSTASSPGDGQTEAILAREMQNRRSRIGRPGRRNL